MDFGFVVMSDTSDVNEKTMKMSSAEFDLKCNDGFRGKWIQKWVLFQYYYYVKSFDDSYHTLQFQNEGKAGAFLLRIINFPSWIANTFCYSVVNVSSYLYCYNTGSILFLFNLILHWVPFWFRMKKLMLPAMALIEIFQQ